MPIPVGPVTLDTVRSILEASPTGIEALDYAAKNGIEIVITDKGDSRWDAANNRILIDGTDADGFARSFVHEVNHAMRDSESLERWNNGTKSEYVESMIDHETEGTVKAIKANRELEDAGKHPNGKFVLEYEYDFAYDQVVQSHRADHPDASAAELAEVGDKAGTARVRAGFEKSDEGVFTDTEDLKTYRKYYESYYDEAHPTIPGDGT